MFPVHKLSECGQKQVFLSFLTFAKQNWTVVRINNLKPTVNEHQKIELSVSTYVVETTLLRNHLFSKLKTIVSCNAEIGEGMMTQNQRNGTSRGSKSSPSANGCK